MQKFDQANDKFLNTFSIIQTYTSFMSKNLLECILIYQKTDLTLWKKAKQCFFPALLWIMPLFLGYVGYLCECVWPLSLSSCTKGKKVYEMIPLLLLFFIMGKGFLMQAFSLFLSHSIHTIKEPLGVIIIFGTKRPFCFTS